MKKLGFIMEATPSHGGTYNYSLAMLKALRGVAGFDITVYGDAGDPALRATGLPVRAFRSSRLKQIMELAAAMTGLRLGNAFGNEDVLLAPIYVTGLLHTSKPFAFTLHDLQEYYYPGNFTLAQRVWRALTNRFMLRRAARVLCESNYVKADIVRLFGTASEKLVVIPAPPLPKPPDAASAEDPDAFRARHGLAKRYLFYPAQFWPHKNHMRLLEAFAQVAESVPDVQLVLTGQKRFQYEAVMQEVARRGLQHRVRHLGHVAQADLPFLYEHAAAIVMPSLFESVSLPVYEAFQAGTPVAASRVVAIPEQIGDAGLLFDPMSPADMASAMLKLLDDRFLAENLAVLGRKRMAEMTFARYTAQLQQILGGVT